MKINLRPIEPFYWRTPSVVFLLALSFATSAMAGEHELESPDTTVDTYPKLVANGTVVEASVRVGDEAVIELFSRFGTGPIFYTLDGAEPTVSAARYTGPFTLTRSAVVRQYGQSADFTQSVAVEPISVQIVPTSGYEADSADTTVDTYPKLLANGAVVEASVQLTGPAVIQLFSRFGTGPVFYTLDGTEPTINALRYTGPFTLTRSAVVRQYGQSESLADSAFVEPISVQIIVTLPVPTIVYWPANVSVFVGNKARFEVVATSPSPLSFQWRKVGQANVVGNGPVLEIAPVQTSDAGDYRVSVLGGPEVLESPVATLTVNPIPADALEFEFGTVAGTQNSFLSVPVLVRRFGNINGFQYSMHWDPSVLAFDSVEPSLQNLTTGNFGSSHKDSGILTVSWDDPAVGGISIADGVGVFAVRFKLIGAPGTTSALAIDGVPTPLEGVSGVNGVLRTVPIIGRSGQVNVLSTAQVTGEVRYYAGTAKVGGVHMAVAGGQALNATTGADGVFSFTLNAGRDYTLTPSKLEEIPASQGVTTLDITLIRRQILGIAALGSPLKLLAADVNGSGSVTTLDITFIRRLILGISTTVPKGQWMFLPADTVFSDPIAPWNPASSRVYGGLAAGLSGQDFLGIRLGDVNNSWTPAAPGPQSLNGERGPARWDMAPYHPESLNDGPAWLTPRLTDPSVGVKKVMFGLPSMRVSRGGTVEVPLTVSGFDKLTSFQFTLGWNARLLRFQGLAHDGVAGLEPSNFNLSNTGKGRLVCSWDDVSGMGQTLGDGSVLLRLKFSAMDIRAAVSPVRFLSSPAAPEITVESVLSDATFQEGSVWIGTGPGDVSLLTPALRAGSEADKGSGTVVLSVSSVTGLIYAVEFADSLSEPLWRTLRGFLGDGGVVVISDLAPVSGQRFYRLRTTLDLGGGGNEVSARD